MTVKLIRNTKAVKARQHLLDKAQEFVDQECIRKMTPYVPVGKPVFHNSGALRDSVQNPEPGTVVYMAPMARHDYYAAVDHRNGGNPEAQREWFEFMKEHHGKEILRGAAEILGVKAE